MESNSNGEAANITNNTDNIDEQTTESQVIMSERQSFCGRVRSCFSFLSVEPVVFLVCIGLGLQAIIGQNLLIYKCCHIDLGYNETICNNLSAFREQQIAVQKESSTILMYQSIIQSVPAIVASLFMGPWSDYHGRKPLLIVPVMGFFIIHIVYVGAFYFHESSAYYILLASACNLFGGFTGFLIGVYGHISDISRHQSRTSRVAFIDLFLYISYPIGTFLSAYIYKYTGFYGTFGIAAVIHVCALLYVIFFIHETEDPDGPAALGEDPPRLVDINSFISVFKTVFKSRENNVRFVLLTLFLCMIITLAGGNDGGNGYLFTRRQFNWTEQEFTLWLSTVSVIRSFLSCSVMPLLSLKLQIHDAIIGIFGGISAVTATIIYALASQPWMMYLGGATAVIAATPAIIIRSQISKVVPKSEVGKVFSLLSSLENCVPLFITPIVTEIYQGTLAYFPGAFFLFSSSCYGLATALLVVIFVTVSKRENQIVEPQTTTPNEDTFEENANLLDNHNLNV